MVTDVNLDNVIATVVDRFAIINGTNIITGEINQVIELKTNIATDVHFYLNYQEGV